MDKFLIEGPTQLNGTVNISGAKNAALPIMTACIAFPGLYTLNNVPDLRDTRTMVKLLEIIGSKVVVNGNQLIIDTTKCYNPEAPYDLVKTMRASFYVLGPLISRFGYCKVSLPGGCAWGPRPVDYHIKALKELGADISLDGGYIIARGKLKGSTIQFENSSVGATGNILMAFVNLNDTVVIKNAAMEPEIVDLCHFLQKIGVSIDGIGTSTLKVQGVPSNTENQSFDYSIIPDRIEAGTFLIGAAMTGGSITIENTNPNHLDIVIQKLKEAGCDISIKDSSITIKSSDVIKPVNMKTDIYPGFPTDLQAQWVALMSVSSGKSYVEDTVYLDRFSHVPELNRLGAKIEMNKNIAYISGVPKLFSAEVMSTDIRASASLIIAALTAEGKTKISRIYHIDRGYEKIEEKLKKINVKINRCND
ncbi:MAG: UDP-N-acetylglucosamine 1-carboxyvinyltransferase [Candidatus Marinimicrobia bacterium]|nr:UDP-N-acetylglucosamine 1-carboxyvinyltransferase [Candidatus Neomarinimicrobiota bacterium]